MQQQICVCVSLIKSLKNDDIWSFHNIDITGIISLKFCKIEKILQAT